MRPRHRTTMDWASFFFGFVTAYGFSLGFLHVMKWRDSRRRRRAP